MSYLLCPRFGDAMEMPHETFVDFPRTDESRTVVLAFRPLLEAVGAMPEHVALSMANNWLYIAPHLQKSLVNLHVPWVAALWQ